MLEDAIDASGHWRTLTLDTHHFAGRTETKRTQVLIEPAVYGAGGSSVRYSSAATEKAKPAPPTWQRWHRTANRLAPPGISVRIRDRSGKQVQYWVFGGPHKPPFSVKSWRFSYESDARHCERALAEVDYLRKTAGAPAHLEPTEKARGYTLEQMHAAGWTDAQLIQYEYCRQKAAVRRVVRAKFPEIFAGLKVMYAAESVKRANERLERKCAGRGHPGVLKDAPAPAEQLDWMATRWRQTTMPGVDIPKGVKVEVVLDPLPSVVTQWRFVDADQARAHDAKRAKP